MTQARWLRPFFRIFSVVLIFTIALSTSAFSSLPSIQPPGGPVNLKPLSQVKANGKLSTRLAMIAGTPSLLAADSSGLLSLPKEGPGSLMRSGDGRIMVYVYLSDMGEKHIQAIRDAGARIVHVSAEYSVVTAYVDPSALNLLEAMDVVKHVREELRPMTGSIPRATPVKANPSAPNVCPWGASRSEGLDQLNVVSAWTNHSVDGTGVKVGVLSDSYNMDGGPITATTDIASGDLPGVGNPCGYTTPVNVVDEYSGGTGSDEGRGMLQIVHDVAPSAQLSFASAFNGYYEFADNIKALRNTAGADVIVDDVFYFREPIFQDGPITNAITTVVNSGAHYFTSAGNQNAIVGGNNVGSYEAPAYRPVTCPISIANHPEYFKDCHDFDPSGGVSSSAWFTLKSGGSTRISMQWAEPTYGVVTDLDFYILDGSNNAILAGGEDSNLGGEPFEFAGISNNTAGDKTYKLVITRWEGAANPRIKFIFISSFEAVKNVQFQVSSGGDIIGPTIGGHSASTSAFSVAAAEYNDSTRAETFSSRGPAVHYFAPDTGLGTPSAPLASPETIVQPDFTATDGGCTTFFGGFSSGCYRFYGTSAAAPHAAAVAALIKQKANAQGQALTRAQMKTILTSTSVTMSNANANAVGSGLLNANSALGALPQPPPGGFQKTAPTNNQTSVPTTTNLSWTPSSGATSYEYCYYSTNVSDCAGVTWPSTTSTSVQVTLANSTVYHWQVHAKNAGGSTSADGDNWFTFTTTAPIPPPAAFAKTGPANNATNVPYPSVNLTWGASTGATSYEYCIFSTNVADCTGAWTSTTSTFAAVTGLTPNTVYHWQVQARNAGGATRADGDNWFAFTTATPDPKGRFIITSGQGPAGGDVTVTVSALMDNGYKLGSTAFNLNYNNALISATGCTADPDNLLAVEACDIVSTPGVVAINGSSPAGVTGTIRLATITFHLNAQAGVSILSFGPITIVDQASFPLSITSTGGRILINGTPQIFLPLLTQ